MGTYGQDFADEHPFQVPQGCHWTDVLETGGGTLRSPVFTDPSTSSLTTFDCVIANLPFSLKKWGREIWENDPRGRAFAGR